MRFKKLKVARILGGALGLLLVLSLVLVPSPVLAVPPLPHQFYGTVTIEAELAPEGTIVSAQIGETEYASTTVDAQGRYGYTPLFQVLADDPDEPGKDGGEAGDTVELYIGGIKAYLYDVEAGEWLEGYPFEIWGITQLNLMLGEIDITPPTVVSTTPEADAPSVAIDAVVSATFDEDIDEATLVFTLDTVVGTVAYDSATKTATFTPAANLDYETTYTASVQASDLATNPMAVAHTWSFTTEAAVDIIPPTVVSTTPEADATGVAVDVVVSATFDEAIDEATLVFTLDTVVGTVAYDSGTKTATFTPAANLDYETTYTASIQASDLAGNPMAEAKVWSFTTRAAGIISFTIPLPAGWNLLSTPILLDVDSDALEQILGESLANIEISWRWDVQNQQWEIPTGYELLPLEAVYLKVSSGASATAEFIPSAERSELPSRELQRGLNLIGPAPALGESGFPDMPLDEALISIADAESGFRGYTMVVSPAHNQTGWAYALGGEIKDLIPFKGYWVVMENADTLYGFSTTPIE